MFFFLFSTKHVIAAADMSAKKIAEWVLLFSFLQVLINECSETHNELRRKQQKWDTEL